MHSLAPAHVAAMQRSAGNRAVIGLVRGEPRNIQRAPAAPGTRKPVAKAPSVNSYIDLLNGFQDLATALINGNGRGLDSVHFGPDLTTAHRSLLWSLRTVLIGAQGDAAGRRAAVGSWPGVSARLLTAVAEAEKLRLPRESLAAVADQIAMINKRLGAAKGRKDVPEADSYEDLDDTIRAIDSMLWENAKLQEAGAGIVREETAGRSDIEVNGGIKDLNAKYRGLIGAVKAGSHVSSRHAQLVESVRAALILARTEKAGSAYAALTKWRQIEGEVRYLLQRGTHYQIINLDIGAVAGRVEQTKGILNAHYAAVHGGNLEAVLTKQRAPGELKARKKIAETFGGNVKAGLAEQTSIEDVQSALDVIQNHLTKSAKPGIWTITNGPTTMQIWEAQAADLHAKAQSALRGYMQSLVGALAHAREDYDSIKLGNSRTKLRILGALGGADDPGSFDAETARMINLRDKTVKPMIDRGDYVGAFKAFLDEKPQVEKRVKAEADYDADLDTGYRRLATTMSVVQVALVALVPIAGEAALATAPAWAVGLTATAAGAGGAFVGEGSRQLVTGDHDAGKLMSRTWQGGVIGAGALGPAATRQAGGVLAAGGGGFAAKGGEVLASGLVGGGQSVAQGGSFGEGFVGGSLGTMGGHATELLPKALQGGVPGKLVQAGMGAGIGEITTGDPLGGAVGALVPSMLAKPPAGAGAHGTTTPTKPAGGPREPAISIGGAEPITGGGGPGAETIPGTGIKPRPPAPTAGPTPGAETIPGTFPPRPPAAPAGPTPGAETIPGTFPPRPPAAPAGPTPGTDTIGSVAPPRPPAPTTGPTPGTDTIGSVAPPRAPAPTETPARPAGVEQPQAGRTAPDGLANKARVPVGAETGADVAGTGAAVSKGPRPGSTSPHSPVPEVPGQGPGPGEVVAGQPGPGAPAPPGNQPAIRPPTQEQGGLLPKSKVPHNLEPSSDPAFRHDELVRMNIEQRAGRDSGRDLPASGADAAPSTPTAKYAPEEPNRFVRTGDKLTAGTTAEKSWVVRDFGRPHQEVPVQANRG